ncbi:hypothetical protein SCHPADRAFT_834401 [Schizopora paradoxa]|uniref:Transcription factor TFIIIC triple barrel domain-containing protein n=1 Tax=Schizopora paradoxa TaxID=27342 RepID=A0A0H2RWC4_9AGAM|nr:hypothetical protein SCHPADRAFT_834401 [Schizopora paradoxa]
MQSPFEGYKQVEAFGPDEEYDEESTEEFCVTLDLGHIDQTLLPSSSTYRLIGLDTPTPFLQLSGVVLKGQHQTLLGTELLFADPIGEMITHAFSIRMTDTRYVWFKTREQAIVQAVHRVPSEENAKMWNFSQAQNAVYASRRFKSNR